MEHLLAGRPGWTYRDADESHSEATRARMAAGEALTDGDRWPWLEAIGEGRPPEAIVAAVLSSMYGESTAGPPSAGSDTERAVRAAPRGGPSGSAGATAPYLTVGTGLVDSVVLTVPAR
ncbi:hypothetical protein [Streptomyces sp. TRM75563]|uniref:hypothetical protein n=1 Tax=Streptomyces sp. TRM75563 TaxID=2817418 RepID=UPI001F605891|nr:hypothetical protein [Streptomyces sp. TRM75563]MCI4042340.1 hypothetical protein [Streptomyces sp. TRM75563]